VVAEHVEYSIERMPLLSRPITERRFILGMFDRRFLDGWD
jgi:hypothetical protein